MTKKPRPETGPTKDFGSVDKHFKPSRVDRRPLSSFQNMATVREVKILAAEEGTTVQALVAEALNMLFEKRGKPPIATP